MPAIYKDGRWYGGDSNGHMIKNNGSDLYPRESLDFVDLQAVDDSVNNEIRVQTHRLTQNELNDIMETSPVPVPDRAFNPAVLYTTRRWLRFDPANKKGLIIKAGTQIKLGSGVYKVYGTDTAIDLSEDITDPGKDYFVFIDNNGVVSATLNKASGIGVYIGRFHTLCVNAGTITMISPASPSSGITVGSDFLVKPYDETDDPDFYAFYNKPVTAVSAGTPYDVITTQHPLSGYSAGDILPESVFCLSWKPKTRFEDAMVYDVTTDICVDVYLQSGTGINTRSVYNATHTVSRQAYNHQGDMLAVGKQLLSDHEFTSIALGSNEGSAIQGASDKTTVGGHVDTNSRRMISAIGCEECCGYLWTWLRDIGFNGQSGWKTTDGRGSFGQEYGEPYVLLAGGRWDNSGSCGSRARVCNSVRSIVDAYCGGRGRALIKNI